MARTSFENLQVYRLAEDLADRDCRVALFAGSNAVLYGIAGKYAAKGGKGLARTTKSSYELS